MGTSTYWYGFWCACVRDGSNINISIMISIRSNISATFSIRLSLRTIPYELVPAEGPAGRDILKRLSWLALFA